MNETNEVNAVTKETGYGHSYASDSSKSPYQSDKKDFSVRTKLF